jgi:hypothetical protein
MKAKDTVLRGSKSAYVRAAKGLAVVTGGGSVPDRDHRVRHWAASLSRVHDSLAIAELDVPWWTYRSIDVVEAWMAARPAPVRVFEYGSGASTLWLARRADEVHSVEHHVEFGALMRGAITADHVSLRVVPPEPAAVPRVPSGKEHHAGLDFHDYVHAIEDVPGRFDVIVVDGRAREACLELAPHHLADDGIVVFDNSWRRRYRPTIARVAGRERRLRGLTPTLPYPEQTSIITF